MSEPKKTLVEGLKVEEGRCTCVVMTPRNIYPGGRHLDDSCPVHTIQPREQEPAPGDAELVRTWTEPPKGLEFLALGKSPAAQPPQELVSLRELANEIRRDSADFYEREDYLIGQLLRRYADAIEATLTRGAVGE